MKKTLFALFALTSIFAAGCKRAPGIAEELKGTWETVGFEKDGIAQELVVSEISFEAKSEGTFEANGNSGVNSFFGEVYAENGKFSVSDKFGSTKMAGDPKAMAFEDDFLLCLTGADSAKIEADILKIGNSRSRSVLSFKRK